METELLKTLLVFITGGSLVIISNILIHRSNIRLKNHELIISKLEEIIKTCAALRYDIVKLIDLYLVGEVVPEKNTKLLDLRFLIGLYLPVMKEDFLRINVNYFKLVSAMNRKEKDELLYNKINEDLLNDVTIIESCVSEKINKLVKI